MDKQFRISKSGGGSDGRTGEGPKLVFNPERNEYFAVWRSDVATNDAYEAYGQRLSPTGVKVGQRVRISNVTNAGSNRGIGGPAVAYDPQSNRYLVVWQGDGLANDNEFEIFGQLVSDKGVAVGSDFRISNALDSPNGNLSDAELPDVAFNSAVNQYLVVWDADEGAVNGDNEVWGQRLDATGAPLGGDFQVSNASATGTGRIGAIASVVYNPQANEYLVAFIAEEVLDGKGEVHGQRISAAGAAVGTNDFRVSQTGLDTDPNRDATRVSLAYNSHDNEYLAAFTADHSFSGVGETPGNNEEEIFGQRITAAGAEVGNSDFRISSTGNPDSSGAYDANLPRIAYDAPANQYLVTWDSDEIENGWEALQGQRLGAGGNEIGSDFHITRDRPQQSASLRNDVARGTTTGEYLTVYEHSSRSSQDYDVYGTRIAEGAKCAGAAATRQGTRLADKITGGSRTDVIATLGGRDTADGGGGADKICGGRDGHDTLRGGGGKDHLDGGPGGGDRCIGGPGRDTFTAGCETKSQ